MSTKNNYAVKGVPDNEMATGMTVLQRVKFELANKQYYSDEEYEVIIYENHLVPDAVYNKDIDQRNMLEAVYAIMQSLANNLSLYRKIETEFATEDQAYKYLQLRLKDMLDRINALENPEEEKVSNVSYMFYNRGVMSMYEENTRVFGTPYESNPALTQFERTMEHEGKTVTTYTGGTEFKAFFRIREDNENQNEVITMFYDVTAPVRPGTLVMYGYGVFIALNRETVENEIYYKSALMKCNGVYNDNYGNITNVPFYTENMKSSVSIGNQTISMLNGNIELITEENSISKKIAINDYFNEFGRTFKITNRYTMDGITHLIAEVEADRQPTYNYTIVIDGVPENEVKVNDTAKLTATPYVNGSVTTGATFEWSSSDTAIASIDGVGNVVFLKEGTVKFTAKWVEKDVSESTSVITVGNGSVTPPTEDYTATITGKSELKLGLPRTYTVTFTDSGGSEVTDVSFTWNVVSDFVVDQVVDGNSIELFVEDEDCIGSTFLLQIVTNETVMTEMEIMVIDMF